MTMGSILIFVGLGILSLIVIVATDRIVNSLDGIKVTCDYKVEKGS